MGPSLQRIRKRVCSFVGPDVPIGPLRAADSRPYRRIAACGGRVRTPAPAEYRETRLSLRRGRSQTGPRAHTVRPYS